MPRQKEKEKTLLIAEDKLPPQDIEAEQSVLGALLLDKNAYTRVMDIVNTGEFYRTNHQKIYETIQELWDKNEPVDVLTVASSLKDKGILEEIGGVGYLTTLVNFVPTSSHIQHYARLVHEKFILRSLVDASFRIQASVYEGKNIEKVLDEAEERIFKISLKATAPAFQHIKPDLREAAERLEQLHKEGGSKLRGIATGFQALDNKIGGLQKSDLIILAARPSLGKTSLALDIARHVAVNEKKPVGMFSLEMSREQVVDRLVAAEATVDLWKLRTGRLKENENDFEFVQEAMDRLAKAPLYIDDSPSPTIVEIRTRARKFHADTQFELLIIDYIQLIVSELRTDNRVQQMTEITRAIKSLSRELSVPILAISQLSRAIEHRDRGKPRLSDLRESGSIEQDADVVLFIHRDRIEKGTSTTYENTSKVIVAKHRNGPVGEVSLYFQDQYASFRDLGKEELEEAGITTEEIM